MLKRHHNRGLYSVIMYEHPSSKVAALAFFLRHTFLKKKARSPPWPFPRWLHVSVCLLYGAVLGLPVLTQHSPSFTMSLFVGANFFLLEVVFFLVVRMKGGRCSNVAFIIINVAIK